MAIDCFSTCRANNQQFVAMSATWPQLECGSNLFTGRFALPAIRRNFFRGVGGNSVDEEAGKKQGESPSGARTFLSAATCDGQNGVGAGLCAWVVEACCGQECPRSGVKMRRGLGV
jgi:hypothetical protein